MPVVAAVPVLPGVEAASTLSTASFHLEEKRESHLQSNRSHLLLDILIKKWVQQGAEQGHSQFFGVFYKIYMNVSLVTSP